MCILCVASRWSRRIVAMLPWLVIPLIVLWAFSQLLPPAFRFEVTSPRLACLFVIFVGLGWYEILMPRLSVWRARRVALMRERKRIKALEAAKWRKEATRRCRNCLTAYRDQNPGGGRFMCTFCGHISRRPVLDISNVVPEGVGSGAAGAGSELGGKNIRLWDGKGWPSDWSSNSSWLGGSFSGLANYWRDRNSLLILRFLGGFLVCIRWVWRRLCRGASCGGVGVPSTSRKVGLKKGEEGLGSQENRGEKARRKAEEKRQARLEKEMLEEEERKQREEVARLVEERRRLRDEKLEAEKVSEREAVAEKERESRRDKESERRRQEKMKEREKGLVKDKSLIDSEDVKKRNFKETEKKYELDKKGDKNSTEVGKLVENSRVQFETGYRSIDNAVKGGVNGSVKVSGSRYFDSVKGSPNTPPKSPTHMTDGSSFWGKSLRAASSFGIKSGKPGSSVDKTQTSAGEIPIVSTSLQSKQNTKSAWNRMGWAWGKGASRPLPSAGDSTGNMHGGSFGGKPNINGVDKNPGIILQRPPVGVELKAASTGSTMSKPWHQLFSNSSDSSSESCSTDVGDQGDEQSQAGTGTISSSLVATSTGSSPFNIYFGSSPAVSLGLADATSVFSNSVLVSVSAAESMNSSGIFSSPSVVPVGSSVSSEPIHAPSYVADSVALLGPVSESLDSFSLNPGARHPSDIGRSILSSDRVPIAGPINRPGPIESPMSKLLPSGIVDDMHCAGDQLPTISEPWGLPSLSFDHTTCASEQGKWQMWETPQLGQSEIGSLLSSDWEKDLMRPLPEKAVQTPFKPENHIPSVFSQQTTLGIPNQGVDPVSSSSNLWLPLNIPAFGSAVNSWEGHDRHQSPTIHANGITQEPTGLTFDSSFLANGHSYEQSANSFWSKLQSQEDKVENNWPVETSGTSTWPTTKTLTRPKHIGGIYTDPDVQSVWSYN
ncbi:uncharacterized protein LOC131074368 isoform X1 [Cryptomeria japonica]|uniref:uncharacterized protein LOC131074368 isoform X1 n=1 Tax=Cryptomeria japonica TaxID=3369 RepID=UPI0027D9F18F|nr:uncharacterized protein LOC131074368 isoform X1 [Cryptomeria japonica]XP_057866953.2 uncharacterized protein LOC131074368 isoform X1 [Cryptomeria japonica]